MNTKQLPYYIAVAETGSLSAAAERLGISQPALSKFLAEAQRKYEMPLFYREKRRMYPTEAGAIIIKTAQQILDTQQHMHSTIKALSGRDKQIINIGVTPHRGAQVMALAYPHLLKRFPNVELVMFEGYAAELWDKLYAGDVDLVLVTVTDDHKDLHVIPFYDEEIVLSVPVFHQLAHLGSRNVDTAISIDIAAFESSPFVMSGSSSTLARITDRLVKEKNLNLTASFVSDNILVVNEMIHTGAGVGLIPRHYAEPRDDVVYFRLKGGLHFTQCIATKKDYVLSPAERYLMYLKSKLYDRKQVPDLESLCLTAELEAIIREFDPLFLSKWRTRV